MGYSPKEAIAIETPGGVISCSPEEIKCLRYGVNLKRQKIVLEYSVPKQGLLAHHAMEVDTTLAEREDNAIAEHLKRTHALWLAGVCTAQLAGLVGRIRNAASPLPPGAAGKTQEPRNEKPRRARIQSIPPTARASKRSKPEDARKVFDDIGPNADGVLTLESVQSYMCDYLGFGQAEASVFFEQHGAAGGVPFAEFQKGYPAWNPFMLAQRHEELLVRKPGSLGASGQAFKPQQLNLDGLEDCEVYACTPTAQVFADFCKRCLVLVGPCESAVFVRDCEDCVFWLAAQQLRTSNCHRCTFYLYSKTEPIIEMSSELAFAPWCASYPRCKTHFSEKGFDPNRNLWNAVFDFTGEASHSHWRILGLDEVVHLTVELNEPQGPDNGTPLPPDNPVPEVTHASLVADPLASGESCGEGIAKIPQTKPQLPALPPAGTIIRRRAVQDARSKSPVGLRALDVA
mmetsp:Transcript_24518/g.47644  ORF Transcript_24518/g.47644 Transcript_24518/m.47644 type:complete len:458 (+) Transcript_24518:55-1428(+)|eukprot:CAMPEP_0172810800 /NCGR_PEP_ID=MMETSP1075-20121228/9025_1 /TAXON_ID=2916 /ORGANISM="Ceratium fusus, Strain PA161109" /LENGTH=457 /DNA_ID=CAMNT_0013650161 /DNA_START=54 /DNA_END=1427 /DNA_ORIENTATION=+